MKINGSNSWDIQVHNDKFYQRAITEGELGIGEAIWMAGGTQKKLMNLSLK